MRRFAVPGLVSLLAVALVGLLIFGVLQTSDDSSLDQAVARGERPAAPDAALPLLEGGGTGRIADHRGGWVLVNFFASWCTPCKTEAPVLNDVQRAFDQRRDGTVLGVAWNDATSDAREFVRDHDIVFPVVRDVAEELGQGYRLRQMPESFLIDPQGRLVAIMRGPIDEEWVREVLDPLVAGKARAG